jgi:hypothetical protein
MPFLGKTQKDTILTKSSQLLPCTIQRIGMASLEYQDTTGKIAYQELFQIQWYSQQGRRTAGRSRAKEINLHKKDTVNLSEEMTYLRNCLTKFHTQYTTGLSLTLVGTALGASTLFVTKDPIFRQQLGIGSAILLLAGFGCSMDAHKWIGRAGWGVSGKGNSVEIHYRFR